MSLIRNFIFRQPILCMKKPNVVMGFVTCRLFSKHHISKNMELITTDSKMFGSKSNDKPLLVMLSWLMAKPQHVMKYANLYLEQGFDVVHVSATPWNLMWPLKGTRPSAIKLLSFLEQNKQYEQVMLHGFSVGAYMWGEVLTYVHEDRQRYDPVIERIVGQVWDSAADVNSVSIGIPKAVFETNVVMQNCLKKYIDYHMKTFYNQATQYYIRSSQMFHSNLVHTPALMLVSNTDPVGSVEANMRVRDSYISLGIPTYLKIFDKSPHVGHYQKYPKEYLYELYTFLNSLNMIKNEKKIRAVLQN